MTARNIDKLNQLHPYLRKQAIDAWIEAQEAMPENVVLVIDQTLRTFEESNVLYAKGRTSPGEIVTNAKAGQSYHNYGLAFDFHMITNGHDDWAVGPLWIKVVGIMKSHGWKWGGDFTTIKDAPHFEKTFGYNWRQLLDMHDKGKFIPDTNYVAI